MEKITLPSLFDQPAEPPCTSVRLRDHSLLCLGDEVTCAMQAAYFDKTFIITEMNPYLHCESGMMCVAVCKTDPQLIIKGIATGGKGLDANWFKKVVPAAE